MDKLNQLKARVREFSDMAEIEASPAGKKFYRSLEMHFEEMLAIEVGLLLPDDGSRRAA